MTQALLRWFDRERRDLPWRRTRDPWAILVSEVMLQQTRVEVVTRYFARFLARFPAPEAMALATEDQILELWAGLGYYRRARNLKRAAEAIVERHGGRFPTEFDAILGLPGVGRYTAGAVASIAFDLPHPVVDGNVARVLARLFVIEGEPREAHVQRELWTVAATLLSTERPGDHNQALMELGATICVPRNPACQLCPIRDHCGARRAGRTHELPTVRPRRAPTPVRLVAALVVDRDHGHVGLVRRAPGGLMAGLHDVPAIEIPPTADARAALTRWLRERFGLRTLVSEKIHDARHAITHRKIAVEVHMAEISGRSEIAPAVGEPPMDGYGAGIAPVPDGDGLRFHPLASIPALALSALAQKSLRALDAAARYRRSS